MTFIMKRHIFDIFANYIPTKTNLDKCKNNFNLDSSNKASWNPLKSNTNKIFKYELCSTFWLREKGIKADHNGNIANVVRKWNQ